MLRSNSSFFSGAGRPVLEIKPNSPFVVFHGKPHEAQPADLTGIVVLHSPESMTVKGVKITLTGTRKVSWSTITTVTPQPIVHKQVFLRETKNFLPAEWKGKAHKINSGEHIWDFKFTLPPNTPESVEGLGTSYIVYDLNAVVDRGYISKSLTAQTHIRVIRTLSNDRMASPPIEQANEDIWANKLAYKITIPQKNFIVGTSIPVDFVLVPLREGVKIKNSRLELLESRHLAYDYNSHRISHHHEVVVAQTESEGVPENSKCLVPANTDPEHMFDEAYRFKMTLDLPKSLKNCRQSVDADQIRISHKIKMYVNILNPEGHTSQLAIKNTVRLFISPNLPPNEDQSVVVDPALIAQVAAQDELGRNAPPLYGSHVLDELYNDIDPSGYMTPGGMLSMATSGTSTPLYAHSRTGSVEDLASLDAALNEEGTPSASALHNRLHNLSINPAQSNRSSRYAPNRNQSSGGSTPHLEPHSHSDPSAPPPNPESSSTAAYDYDMDALTRTPSYNTAVRTPARPVLERDLPSYEIATSRPSSPVRTPRSGQGSPIPRDESEAGRELDEETERNTVLNTGRGSPRRGGAGAGAGRSGEEGEGGGSGSGR